MDFILNLVQRHGVIDYSRVLTRILTITACRMGFRSLNRAESDGGPSDQGDYHCDFLLPSPSHCEADASSPTVELRQPLVVNMSPSARRSVKPRRCKKSSKAALYAFADPLSKATRSLNLSKLARSEFDWRTMTAIRPTTEFEERFITRLVELERLQVLKLYNVMK